MRHEPAVVSNANITSIRELRNSEYEEYSKAVIRLVDFSSDQQLYAIVRLNYDDYQNLLKQYYQLYAENPSAIDWIRMERMVLDINRHILNYLSAIRTFLDHSETNLKRRYGMKSERFKRFKKACFEAYDSKFSYRFLYALRNYAQHCGMPLGQLTFHSKEVSPHSKDACHSLMVKFNRDELLRKYDKWGSQLKEEIQQFPSMFEITSHINEMMKCIEKINLTLIEDDLPELVESAEFIQQLLIPIKERPGFPCILRVIKHVKGKELELEMQHIPLHLVAMVMKIKSRLD